jgi:predicted PurR-regulated permease PerM
VGVEATRRTGVDRKPIVGNTRGAVNAVHNDDRQSPPAWYRVGARLRGAATLAGLVALVVGLIGGLGLPQSRFPEWLAFALLVGGFALLVWASP